MTPPEQIDAYATKLAGLLGACISLNFITGTWPERLVMAVGGSLISYYASPWASAKTGLPEGLCGFLLGLFGMAICAKVWEFIRTTPIAEFWDALMVAIKRWIGV